MNPSLKRPVGVYLLAILFLLAPLGNILISFAGSGVQNWYDPSVLKAFLQSIPLIDWVWLTALFVTGILLFKPHKLSWSFAIFTLVLILIINARRLYNVDPNSIDPSFLKAFSAFAILCTFSVLIISFYFRFPYLDRRANWFTTKRRVDVRTLVTCEGKKGITESLSKSGSRISFEQEFLSKKDETALLRFPEISAVEVRGQIVERAGRVVHFEFREMDAQFRMDLVRWLKSRGVSE